MLNEQVKDILTKAQLEVIEPETIRRIMPGLSEEDFNELEAVITVKTSNAAFESFYAFENVVWALNGVVPNTRMIEGANPEWIWYACEIMQKMRPNMELAQEVVEYIKKMYVDSGVYFLHPYITEASDVSDMSVWAQIYVAAKHKAENGPYPIEATSFINRQAIEFMKFDLYSKNKLKEMSN